MINVVVGGLSCLSTTTSVAVLPATVTMVLAVVAMVNNHCVSKGGRVW